MGTTRVYTRHVRQCGFCLIPGARDWFVANGLDWRDFVRNGVPASTLLATGDPMATQAIRAAERESQK